MNMFKKPIFLCKYRIRQRRYRKRRAAHEDRLEQEKDAIDRKERQAVRKKAQYDRTKGQVREIIVREIHQIMRDLERKKGPAGILQNNIELMSVANGKVEELLATLAAAVTEEHIDDVASDLQEEFDRIEMADDAAKQAETISLRQTPSAKVPTGEPAESPEQVPTESDKHTTDDAKDVELDEKTRRMIAEFQPEDDIK